MASNRSIRRLLHRRWSVSAVVVLLTLGLLPGVAASAGNGTDASLADQCAELISNSTRVDQGVAVIETANVVAAEGSAPEHCDIKGMVDGEITFQMRFPTSEWNGKYFQTGCGGFCGAVPIDSCSDALSRGYAVAAEDSGHQGSGGDGSWALDNRRAEVNWGYRSPHVVAQAGKQYVEDFYGQKPAYSYFQGCSTGGRQALMQAQRFPDDFDGIVAGAPALYQNQLAPLSQGHLETVNRDNDGRVILTREKSAVLAEAVQEACGTDGVVENPDDCHFEPASLQCVGDVDAPDCLTTAQVEVAEAFYAPPVDRRGRELYPGGLVVGSEGGWPGFSIGTDESLSGGGNYAQEVLRYLAFPKDPGESYSLFDFDPTRDAPKLRAKAQIYNADSVQLQRFNRRGGKLLVWHGWADPLITPEGTVDYVRDAVAANGGREGTEEWLRLFLLPGVYHCGGGPGEGQVDWLSALENWVEDEQAPSEVVAEKRAGDGELISTRIVKEYLPD